MAVRAVLFDLGNTLLDYPPKPEWTHWGIYQEMQLRRSLSRLCQGPPPEEALPVLLAHLDGEPIRERQRAGLAYPLSQRLTDGLAVFGLTCPPEVIVRIMDDWFGPVREVSRPFPEVAETLQALRRRTLPLAIISNTALDCPGHYAIADLAKWELDGYFSAFVFSGDEPWCKPHPEFMREAARRLGVAPPECLVVGDSLEADVGGAQAAGMPSAWVNRAGRPCPPGPAAPDHEVRDVRQVLDLLEDSDP